MWATALIVAGVLAAWPAGADVDYQLGGAYPPADQVGIVVRDRTDDPAAGRFTLCYVNAFQTQPDELDDWERDHPDLLLRRDGDPVIDPGWPDEALFDITTDAKRERLADIVGDWFAGCRDDGFLAIEADNLDSWGRSDGLVDADDAEAFARLLTDRAHAVGLPIAQKNTAELTDEDLGFDLAVTEECSVFDECATYIDRFGPRVLEIEYTDNGRTAFAQACRAPHEHSIQLRDRDVLPRGEPGHVARWCPR